MLRTGILFAIVSACAFGAAPDSIDSALAHMYNQDYATAHEILNRVIAAHPQDPLPYAFRASAHLFYELDRLGVLESEFLLDDKKIIEKKAKIVPDPKNRDLFIRAVQDAEARAGGALKVNPNDPNAIFAMCIAEGVTTDYMAFVEKKQISSMSVAKRSNGYAQHLMQLDPKFYDAYLTAGITEYMLGSLPFFLRWFIHFDNVDGSKAKGLERLQLVAREGHYFRPFAKILLSIIALREKRPRDAHQFLTELAFDYPQNKLFRTELNKLNAQMGMSAN